MPKIRFTADLEPNLYQWLMDQAEKEGKSRNQLLGEAVELLKKQLEQQK